MWKFFHWMFSLVAAGQHLIVRRLTRAGMLVRGLSPLAAPANVLVLPRRYPMPPITDRKSVV